MQRGVDDNISAHPSDEELAWYIDNELDNARRAEIERHLVECDRCSDAVALVLKYQKKIPVTNESEKEPKPVNNINYKGGLGALSGIVACIALFLLLPPQKQLPFIKYYTQKPTSAFLAPKKVTIKDIDAKNQELNDFIKQLLKTKTDFSQEFVNAKNYLKEKKWDKARESYNIVIVEIEESKRDKIQKLRDTIIIQYHILLLSMKEGDKESEEEYKDIIRDNIRRLKLMKKDKN